MYQVIRPYSVEDKRFTSVTKELLYKCLTLYKAENLIRVGKSNDGGYIISDIGKYDILLSGGIGGDISFEKAFTEKYNTKCVAFDGENIKDSSNVCKNEKNILYVAKNIGNINNDKFTNLKDYLNRFNNIFVKMDIEGGEFPFLYSLTMNELKNIKQMTFEFHFVDIIDKWKILEKISETHYLIHFHANNNNRVVYRYDNIWVPGVFECTYIRKTDLTNIILNDKPLPLDIDNQNTNSIDYMINCPPWVN